MATFIAGPAGADMSDLSLLLTLIPADVGALYNKSSSGFQVTVGSTTITVGAIGVEYNSVGWPVEYTIHTIEVASGGQIQFSIHNLGTKTIRKDLHEKPFDEVIANLFSGNDFVQGSDSADVLLGFAGNDMIFGKGGRDRLDGGAGNDILNGGLGKDIIKGGTGFDTASYADRDQAIKVSLDGGKAKVKVGGAIEDSLKSIEAIIGGKKGDAITGDKGINLLSGLGGADRLDGGGGSDELYGGDGRDTLHGGKGSDLLHGGNGRDRLFGGDGADMLNGGAGNDRLVGGKGPDSFVFDTAIHGAANVDTIVGFTRGEDKIVVSKSVFGGGLSYGAMTKADFAAYFVYDKDSGKVFHDRFATGGEAETVLFAKLEPGLKLSHTDFVVIG